MEEFLNSDTWIIISVAIIAPAIGMWIGGLFKGKKKIDVKVIAICPHCQADIGLEKVRNYICGECHGTVVFFNSLDGTKPRKELEFNCNRCGVVNFKGLKFCPNCKMENSVEKKI
jgi:uncharacterized OB-fold protein